MIVDDDSMVYRVVKKTIPWENYQMSVKAYAPNGARAIEYLTENPVDIVLVDLSMPHMGGLEFIRRVYEFLPKTVFVILSSHSEYRLVKKSFCMGAFDYLLKVDVDDEIIVDELLRRVTDRLKKLQRGGERPFDLGDLISKLDGSEKDSLFYKVQVLKPEAEMNRLKIAEKLNRMAEEVSMVYGCYEGYMTILYYDWDQSELEQRQFVVNEQVLDENSGIRGGRYQRLRFLSGN